MRHVVHKMLVLKNNLVKIMGCLHLLSGLWEGVIPDLPFLHGVFLMYVMCFNIYILYQKQYLFRYLISTGKLFNST